MTMVKMTAITQEPESQLSRDAITIKMAPKNDNRLSQKEARELIDPSLNLVVSEVKRVTKLEVVKRSLAILGGKNMTIKVVCQFFGNSTAALAGVKAGLPRPLKRQLLQRSWPICIQRCP